MDTFAEISCYSTDRVKASEAIKAGFAEIERIEKLLSKFDEKSEISNINVTAGQRSIGASGEVFKLIERSIGYSKATGGAFDITVEPFKKGRYKKVILDSINSSVHFLDNDIKIDLGGIAKGYAVDRAKDILFSYGIENAMVNIGGNIFALGSPPGKKNWRIGIRDPKNKDKIIHTVDLKDKAVSTSGDYERPSHIIDPATGDPVSKDVASVTVVSDSAEKADALSTAVFVMGRDRGQEFARPMKGTEVFIVPKDLY